MARFVIQSGRTHEFLHSNPRSGDVSWTPSLAAAIAFGVVTEPEEVRQLIDDHCDRQAAMVVDLDGESVE